MFELKEIILEQLKHRTQILKLTIYNMKSEYANHYLGLFWNIIQPVMQLMIYFVVFGLGLRGGGDRLIDGVPFLLYLVTGVFSWLFISQGINAGSSAILSNIGLLSKMKFPPSVFISIVLTNKIINLLFTTSLILIVSIFNDLVPLWHYLYFFYFLFCSLILIYAISLLTSVLVVVIRDTKNLLSNFIRMCFFLTPIFWSANEAHDLLQVISNLNPFAYLLGIYRFAFIYGDLNAFGTIVDHLYFWVLTITLLIIGSIVHHHFKKHLIDYI